MISSNQSDDSGSWGALLSQDGLQAEEAWEQFFNRFDEFIHRVVVVALRKYHGHFAADEVCDLAQKIYERLIENDFRAVRHFRGQTDRSWRAYLMKIGYNLVLDYCQKEYRQALPGSDIRSTTDSPTAERDQPVADTNQERALYHREIKGIIERSLLRNGHGESADRDRLIFILRHYHGYSAEEVAQALGITTNHVNTIYHRVKKRVVSDLAKTLGKKN